MMTEKELSEIEQRCLVTPEGPWLVELIDYDKFFVAKHVETRAAIDKKFYPPEVAQRVPEFDVTAELPPCSVKIYFKSKAEGLVHQIEI